MQIQRLEMEQIRRFREPLIIENLEPGLNLFTGPNEAGKSSIVRAIRAAFLERSRSNKVEDLATWGVHNPAPSIKIHFRWNDQPCILEKQFLAKKSCSLKIGDETLTGEDAEDRLAKLLGFTLAAKGGIRDEHLGVPGVLWIEQGKGHELEEAVRASADHLRSALPQSMESLGSRHGDAVASAVARQLGELLTASGKPRGDYSTLLSAISALQNDLTETRGLIATYREQVDELGFLRAAHHQDIQNKPWMQLRAQAEAVQGRLKAALECATELKTLETAMSMLRSQSELLVNNQKQRKAAEHEAAEIAKGLDRCKTAAEAIGLRLEALREAEKAAKAAWETAREQEQQARQAQELRAQNQETLDLKASLAKNQEALEQARHCAARLSATSTCLSRQRLEEPDLVQLRALDQQIRENQIRLERIATKMHYRLEPGVQMHIGSESVAGMGEWSINRSVQLRIPGVGTLQLSPGEDALSDLDQKQAALQHEMGMKLAGCHLESLPEAEILWAAIQRDRAQMEQDSFMVKSLAPEGVEALARLIADAQARLSSLEQAFSTMPAATTPILSLDEAREAREMAEQHWRLQTELLHAAETKQAGLTTEMQMLQANHAKQQALIQETDLLFPQWIEQSRILEIQQGDNLLQQNRLREQLTREDPEMLQQDADRYTKSAQVAEDKHRERAERMGRLEAQLETSGAQGLEERLAEKESDLAAKERRAQRLNIRAQGLGLLSSLIEGHRDALLQKLQAPLQARVDHYLRLWSPGARLKLGAELEPFEINRERGLLGVESAAFSALSFGAREQVALLMRLAYADVLKEAQRPTLIILDDVLAHSDTIRLDAMKRILNDAAKRHQILLLTCHEEDWADMGVPARTVGYGLY
ncbi:AAA family ATPase [Acidithiobacillus sp.]